MMAEILIGIVGLAVLVIIVCFYVALCRYTSDFWMEEAMRDEEDWYTRHKTKKQNNQSDNERNYH